MRSILCVISLLVLASCGGGGGTSPAVIPPVLVPPSPPATSPDFSGLIPEADASPATDLAIMVGDETGVLFTYEKGNYSVDDQVSIASASKMIFGLLIWDLVESGDLAQTDTPQSHISFWTSMAGDARSEVTLDQLMGFISGFNEPPGNPGCIGEGSVALSDCVQTVHDGGLDTLPGASYYYGPEHMQIAGLMATEATGDTIGDLLNNRLAVPLGLTQTEYPAARGDNPRFSGNMRSSAQDLAQVLIAVLAGDLVDDRTGYLADRTANVVFGHKPAGLESIDWHYGFGFWKECDEMSYRNACDTNPIISSPGAFGMTPWIDFDTGYWGIVAMEDVTIDGRPASEVSVELEQALQTLIEAELN
ncbi:MAG: serine hydrolase domain-containing protein [Pseudomonadota bacterium]